MTEIDLLQSVKLKLSAIEPNKGQIEGLPKNLTIAKKLTHNGYDVYLLSNPNSIKSADFILKKKDKLYL